MIATARFLWLCFIIYGSVIVGSAAFSSLGWAQDFTLEPLSLEPLTTKESQQTARQQTGWLTSELHPHIQVKLSAAGVYDEEAESLPILLEIELDDEWKTYWRSPGEGGIAPEFQWHPDFIDSSDTVHQDTVHQDTVDQGNVQQPVELIWHWPTPQRYLVSGIETLGYVGAQAIPLELHIPKQLANKQQTLPLVGHLVMSSCTVVCVLTDFEVRLETALHEYDLSPSEQEQIQEVAFRYQQAWSQVPRFIERPQDYLDIQDAVWDQQAGLLYVKIHNISQSYDAPDVFIDAFQEGIDDITVKPPLVVSQEHELQAWIPIEHWLGALHLEGQELHVTLVDNTFAYEFRLSPRLGVAPSETPSIHPLLLVLLALVGGFILNLMPCVLPVLGIKLQSVLVQQGQQTRPLFLSAALGIVVSFWLLALGILTAKWFGAQVGWGIQFQNPYFIGFMVLVTWGFTLNLAGAFEIRLPSTMSRRLEDTGGQSRAGYFVQGMFATLLATPCSAPFLGTAVAYALIAEPFTLLGIFTALGVGMALPWLVVALYPKSLHWLPKPGAWMVHLKWLFSAMLALTSIWLMTVLKHHVSAPVWLLFVTILWVIALLLLIRAYGIKGGVGGVVVTCVLLLASIFTTVLKQHDQTRPPLQWETFNLVQVQQAIQEGQVVFVDVTADWCITCKANAIGVLQQDPVYSRLQQSDIRLFQADWTLPSETVTDFLQQHHRYGVPFNIVYGAHAPNGIELPVLLTSGKVLEAIEQAK